MRQRIQMMSLIVLVVASALAVSWTVHRSRQLTSDMQTLQRDQDAMKTEWGQLLLEQSTWGGYARVERLAREELNMIMPEGEQTVMVTP